MVSIRSLAARAAIFRPSEKRSPLESALVRRLDIFLMTFGCISQVIKYLDQQNISSAYVSGMQRDLNLTGNELNFFTTYFNISYCIFLIPSQIMLTYVRPSYWLPGLELAWGVITGLLALSQSATHVYVLRFFLGMFESSAWPGMMTILAYWYTPAELAKRMAFYHSCQYIGSMMSGALQVAILNTLDGSHGLAGWRSDTSPFWLFVINAIMTVVVGFAGIFMLPDYPNKPNPRAFWFTSEHAEMARERLNRHGRAQATRITWAGARRTFVLWISYFVPFLYIATVLAQYGYNYFNLFLQKAKNTDGTLTWSSQQVNAIPIGGGAITVLFVWVWGIASDILQTRWTLIVIQGVIGLIPSITMSIWTQNPKTTPIAAAYASYFLTYLSLGTAPLIMSWLADMVPHDSEARTLIVGYTIAGVYSITAWSQVLVWPASQAPYYKSAWQLSIGLWLLVIFLTCLLRFLDRRYSHRDEPSLHSEEQEQIEQEKAITGAGHESGLGKSGDSEEKV
ncbi:major facilitator superfamily transporter [Thozetella sp. PMI_491]|nr:major facilitator superfamily transporter [Thozetella sp. PMI_491]